MGYGQKSNDKTRDKFAGGSGIGSAVGNGFVFILFILSRNVWYIDVMMPTSECPEDLETHLRDTECTRGSKDGKRAGRGTAARCSCAILGTFTVWARCKCYPLR